MASLGAGSVGSALLSGFSGSAEGVGVSEGVTVGSAVGNTDGSLVGAAVGSIVGVVLVGEELSSLLPQPLMSTVTRQAKKNPLTYFGFLVGAI